MREFFEKMKEKATTLCQETSSHSSLYKGCNYLLKYYEGLTRCLGDPRIPLDNNRSERELRSPVVGRKTWYGTHSKEGAKSAAVHFTITSSCKLNDVNPREYYHAIITAIHHKKQLFTPSQFRKMKQRENEKVEKPPEPSQSDQNTS